MALLFPKAVQSSIPRMPVTSLSAIVERVGHDLQFQQPGGLNLELQKSTNRYGPLLWYYLSTLQSPHSRTI